MPYPLRPLDGSRSPRHHLGAELRHWRKRARLTQDAIGASVHVSGDLIGKIEKAERRCDGDLAARLDAALDTGGVLVRAWRLADEADRQAAEADNRPPPALSSLSLEQLSIAAPDRTTVLRRDFIAGAAAITGTASTFAPPPAPARAGITPARRPRARPLFPRATPGPLLGGHAAGPTPARRHGHRPAPAHLRTVHAGGGRTPARPFAGRRRLRRAPRLAPPGRRRPCLLDPVARHHPRHGPPIPRPPARRVRPREQGVPLRRYRGWFRRCRPRGRGPRRPASPRPEGPRDRLRPRRARPIPRRRPRRRRRPSR
ncbi:helix-turn-helix domain-containing protein [Streptomyces sp. SID5474]|nr:helix-turn-helix domain-containing protein [Streptomyces sp. SID5474]